MSLFDNLIQRPLASSQYYTATHKKTQIFLHHTAGNSDPFNQINDWNTDGRGRIATCVVIGRGDWDGKVVQAFSSKYWAYHLGVKSSVFNSHGVSYRVLDKTSIGIEICNWGPLEKVNGKFYNYVQKEVPSEDVCTLPNPFRGFKYFQHYTPAQIERVRELLLYWKDIYDIPIAYNEDIWGVTKRALLATPGVFTHCSVRADKVDVYPHPGLIAMLKTL